MGYYILIHEGGTSRYAPDLPLGVRRVGMFVTIGDAREYLRENGYGSETSYSVRRGPIPLVKAKS